MLLGRSSIGKNDLVVEIGPGKGIITEELIERSGHVLAVEIDSTWYAYLRDNFSGFENVTFYQEDFLQYKLPSLPYKVFANIPFSIEGKIIRKLIDDTNPPDDCYLVMMKDVAYRLAAPFRDNMFSIMHKPWFDFSIYHHFRRTDFEPVPNVNIVMLRVTKKIHPSLPWSERQKYHAFVQLGFGHGQSVVKNLQKRYGKLRVKRICEKLGITKDTKPSHVSLDQWIRLWELVCGNN